MTLIPLQTMDMQHEHEFIFREDNTREWRSFVTNRGYLSATCFQKYVDYYCLTLACVRLDLQNGELKYFRINDTVHLIYWVFSGQHVLTIKYG